MTLLLLVIGQALGGRNGMTIALIFAGVMNFVSYFFSDKIALAMYRAKPVTREELPRAYEIVERLTQRIGLPMPKIYVIPTDSPNAFATGRNPSHASVAVTQGILQLLTDEELEGVLAHELGHVRNRDILISSIAATLAFTNPSKAAWFRSNRVWTESSRFCLSMATAAWLAIDSIISRSSGRKLTTSAATLSTVSLVSNRRLALISCTAPTTSWL